MDTKALGSPVAYLTGIVPNRAKLQLCDPILMIKLLSQGAVDIPCTL